MPNAQNKLKVGTTEKLYYCQGCTQCAETLAFNDKVKDVPRAKILKV